jgi:putative DNA primase/helicase
MSGLPFDPDAVASAAHARANPIPMEGEDNVVEFSPQPSEGIIPLGYDHSTFFYLSRSSRQVHTLTADQHTKRALMAMAAVPHFWQRTKFVSEKGQVFWDDAADWLMTECRSAGIYNPERVRGRGAWFDHGRAVLHMGDRLLVDGRSCALMLPGSTSIYPAALPLSIHDAAPLSNADAHRICEISAKLRWVRPISGTLFAGWIVCAMVCGALRWRPSIWVTGASGSGKSWLLDNVLAPLVGPIALQVQSKTSEAGIRQTLNSDALPVVFDEFEREDSAAAIRVQGVLDLMRQASSESEKKIIKGTQQQTSGRSFRIRSAFAFSSINVGLAFAADESRVSILALQPPLTAISNDQEAFRDLAAQAALLITPAYAAGLLARSVGLLPVIRDNAEVFAVAVAAKLGTRRLGDQVGTLLAGAYSLHSGRPITQAEASAYLDRQDWGDSVTSDTQKDEDRLLSHLSAARIRVSLGNGPTIDVTLGRLMSAAFGSDDRIPVDTADFELREYGVRAHRTAPFGAWVSTSHPALAKALAGTPWAANWSRTLSRLPGATSATEKVIRFALGHRSRAVWLPLNVLDQGE